MTSKFDDPLIGRCIKGYHIQHCIGKGGFGRVYQAKCIRTGQEEEKVAIKMIEKKNIRTNKLRIRVREEVRIHSQLEHPAILKCKDFFEDGDFVCLVLELCPNGDLQDHINTRGTLTEDEARRFMKGIVEGLSHLHSKKFLHRDLKLSNLLLSDNMDIKIADFGMATEQREDEKNMTMCGTPNYIPPEVFTRKPYGFETEVWSLGCVFHTFLTGRPPFDSDSIRSTQDRVVGAKYVVPKDISEDAKDLLLKLLQKEPNNRIKLYDIMNHPFMTNTSEYSNRFRQNKWITSGSLDSGVGTTGTSSTPSSRIASSSSRCRPLMALPLSTVTSQNEFAPRPDGVGRPSEVSPNKHHSCPRSAPILPTPPPTPGRKSPRLHHRSDHVLPTAWTPSSRNAVYAAEVTPPLSPRVRNLSGDERRRQASDRLHDRGDFGQDVLRGIEPMKLSGRLSPSPRLAESPNHHHHGDGHSNTGGGHSDEEHRRRSPLPHGRPPENQCSHHGLCERAGKCAHHGSCACRPRDSFSADGDGRDVDRSGSRRPSPKPPPSRRDSPLRLPASGGDGMSDRKLWSATIPPNAVRLRPTRQTTNNTVVSILDSGEVCVEFVSSRGKVVDVLRISTDGMEVYVYQPKGVKVSNDAPPELPADGAYENYSYEYVPAQHRKKYAYATRFVEIVRSKTPKITLYNTHAKCMLMENGPCADFEVVFVSGEKILRTTEKFKITVGGDVPVIVDSLDDATHLPSDVRKLFLQYYEDCFQLESNLTMLESQTGHCYFPVISGRKATTSEVQTPPSFDRNKENRPTNVLRDRANQQNDRAQSGSPLLLDTVSDYSHFHEHSTKIDKLGQTAPSWDHRSRPGSARSSTRNNEYVQDSGWATQDVISDHSLHQKRSTKSYKKRQAAPSTTFDSRPCSAMPTTEEKVFVENIGWALLAPSGKIIVYYNDGSQLSFLKNSNFFRYTSVGGQEEEYSRNNTPDHLQNKAADMCTVIERLKKYHLLRRK